MKANPVDYESPEILASYDEDDLTAEAAVAMHYGEPNGIPL
jgi:hypothetical protein